MEIIVWVSFKGNIDKPSTPWDKIDKSQSEVEQLKLPLQRTKGFVFEIPTYTEFLVFVHWYHFLTSTIMDKWQKNAKQ